MVDSIDKQTRSKVMSAIRSKGNRSTELVLVDLLRRNKISGWRRHYPIEGKPDFAWIRFKVAVFVDGCFWHGCLCRRAPKSNLEFWEEKIFKNKKRDRRVTRHLREMGWKVIRVKECQLRDSNKRIVRRIKLAIQSSIEISDCDSIRRL